MRAAGKPLRERVLALWFEALWLSAMPWVPARVEPILVLAMAALLDYLLGDPWGWPHPVQAIGWVIQRCSQWLLKRIQSPFGQRLAGVGLAVGVIGATVLLSWAALATLAQVSLWLRWLGEAVMVASCFAGRSLRQAAEEVMAVCPDGPEQDHQVSEATLKEARSRLAKYVGRDTEQLSPADIRRAVMETVSENAIDGVLAPLFYALCGAALGLAGPVAMGYKAASTLDSMVGYRRSPYTYLGWFSARLEDGLTWLPCRLSVGATALLSGHPRRVLSLCWRDARQDPSPNAGWSECAYAAALGVQLGGENRYRGQRTLKPLLGNDRRAITQSVIQAASQLTRRAFLCGLGLGYAGLWLISSI